MRIHVATAREGQQLVGQFGAEGGRLLGVLEQRTRIRIGKTRLEELQIAGYDQQQVVKIVGDTTRELANSFHFLGLRQATLTFP
jgi:hypothetical protein